MAFLVLACLLATSSAAAPTTPRGVTLRACNISELNAIRFSAEFSGSLIATGTVQDVCPVQYADGDFYTLIIEDRTGACFARWDISHTSLRRGDIVEFTCHKDENPDHGKIISITSATVLGAGPISKPLRLALDEIDDRRHDCCIIETEGVVVDAVPDEIDPAFDILLLKGNMSRIPLFIPSAATNRKLIGARIRATGRYFRLVSGQRRFSGPYMTVGTNDIQVVEPPRGIDDIPLLAPNDFATPKEVAAMGLRAVEGVVLAKWNGANLMLDVSNSIVNARLLTPDNSPVVGDFIRLAGYPETDLYKINITKAIWKPQPGRTPPTHGLAPLASVNDIFRQGSAETAYDNECNGRLIRLTGLVQILPANGSDNLRIYVDVNGHRLPIDVSNCPEALPALSPGCLIEATGRCLMAGEPWRIYDVFPQIRECVIIARQASDIRVLKRPPWWTPRRLIVLIIALATLLFFALIWNRLLNRLVVRRGRQLYRADIERASEALRVEERTRLAVELHDSLSQNLTGVALQINAGRNELAARALKSCREELRNCLWDLRNNAIDCDSMDEAIRQTLAPHVEDITLNVRFNVPRKNLSDNTAYAILRIVRELVMNAIRHGGASTVRIAGSLEPERLLFSVRDDGCGFDPENRPGIGEGHFGLQGVCERVASLGGTVKIESEIGTGTKATVVIPNTTPSIQLET